MFTPTALTVVTASPTRQCGECTACCTTGGVLEFDKPSNAPCKHLGAAGAGCSIYDHRPGSCRQYTCCWLAGALPEAYRPDKAGVVFEFRTETHIKAYLLRADVSADRIEFLFQKLQKSVEKTGRQLQLEITPPGMQCQVGSILMCEKNAQGHMVSTREATLEELSRYPEHLAEYQQVRARVEGCQTEVAGYRALEINCP